MVQVCLFLCSVCCCVKKNDLDADTLFRSAFSFAVYAVQRGEMWRLNIQVITWHGLSYVCSSVLCSGERCGENINQDGHLCLDCLFCCVVGASEGSGWSRNCKDDGHLTLEKVVVKNDME